MTLQADLEAVASAIDSVTGLRVQTKAGQANAPAAVVELAGIQSPSRFGGGSEVTVRILLLVQVGDFRSVLERIYAYADPAGTTSTSVYAALLGYAAAGDIEFDGPGLVPYNGKEYGGGIFTVRVFTS